MLPRRQPPTQARYLRARLRTFTKPAVWGTLVFASVVGLGIWQYWTNPGLMRFWENKQVADSPNPNPTLSKEDKAIGADIDNLSVLNQEFNKGSTLATPSDPNENIESVGSKVDEATLKKLNAINSDPKFNASNQTPTPLVTSKLENPFLSQAQYLLRNGSINNSESAPPLTANTSPILAGGNDPRLGMRLSNPTNQDQNTTPVSASGVFNQSQSGIPKNNNTFGQTQFSNPRPYQVAPATNNNSVGISGSGEPLNRLSPGTPYNQQPALNSSAYNQQPVMNSSQSFYSNLINQSPQQLPPSAPVSPITPTAPNLSPLPIPVPTPASTVPIAPGVYGAGGYSPYSNYGVPRPVAPSNYNNTLSTPAPSNYNNSTSQPIPVPPANYSNSTFQPIPVPQPQPNIFPRGQ